MKSLIKIGTRGSKLAIYQAELVRSTLKEFFPMLHFELVKIRTGGDMIRRGAIGTLGPAIFTREIEDALLAGEVDLGVHSAKDLATELPQGLEIGAILNREDPRDCLVAREGQTLETLPEGARIGTSSLRRRSQLKKLRPGLEMIEMRGNVDSRLKKIEEAAYDGMVIAYAGLKRLGLTNFVAHVFDEDQFLPQAGQGAVAVEIRTSDGEMHGLTHPLNHEPSWVRVSAERSFLRRLEGGCQIPAGVSSKIDGGLLILKGAIFSLDGEREISDTASGAVSDCEKLGAGLAEKLLETGGKELLQEIRKEIGDRSK